MKTARHRSGVDMLHGTLWDKMVLFAVPLALTSVLLQLLNAADVAVLGRYVSKEAMAAVGNNVPIVGLLVSLCVGLSIGANVLVARYIGMRDSHKVVKAVHTAFVMAVVFGLVACLAAEMGASRMMLWLEVPEAVQPHALTYLRYFLLGLPFISIFNFLAAVFRSKGDTKTPMYALLAATAFNICGNLVAVLLFELGTAGVALSTVMANAVAAGVLFFCLLRSQETVHLRFNQLSDFDFDAMRIMIRIGLPAGIQSMVFSLSNLVVQSAINSLGPDVMAASAAAFAVEINIFGCINAFGLAATTFVSQNYGAGNLDRCRRATWVSFWINMAVTVVLVALVIGFGHELLGMFSDSQEVIALGMIRLWYVALPEPLSVLMETVSDAMRGYGYSMPPAVVTLVCICSVRLLWVYTIFAYESSYEVLMAVYPASWFITSVALVWLYVQHQKNLALRFAGQPKTEDGVGG